MDLNALTIAERSLSKAIVNFIPPVCAPLDISPWIAMSLLQKSIRRGNDELAQRAAATLLTISPERLWRRCGGIAFEDISVADIETVAVVVASLTGKRFRVSLGGEWKVASYIVSRLTNAPKCRAADDLLIVAENHPRFEQARRELPSLTVPELMTIAIGPASLPIRALAVWYGVGTYRRPSKRLRLCKGSPALVFKSLADAGIPLIDVAYGGFKKVGEVLCPFVSLLCPSLSPETKAFKDDEFPPEIFINGIPGWAYDMFSRDGRGAYQLFLEGDTETARWVRDHAPPRQRVNFLGSVIFRIEGGLVRSRLRWPTGDELRRLADLECMRLHGTASEILALARDDIRELNEVRAHVC